MKSLDLNQLENISGNGFWDGFCAGAGAASAIVPFVTAVPGLNIAAGVVAGGCLAYTLLSE